MTRKPSCLISCTQDIAARRLRRFDGEAGRDEAARQGHGR
jgi:hypothetical protein